MNKILITGVAGGIGSILAENLLNQGFSVVGLDNLISGTVSNLYFNKNGSMQFIEGSICDQSTLERIEWTEIAYVFHLAAISSLPSCEINPLMAFDINFRGTMELTKYALRAGVIKGFFFASTSAVYEGVRETVFDESLEISPHLVYSQTKHASENYLNSLHRNYGFPAYSFRFFNVFGPNQDLQRKSPPLLNYLVREAHLGRSPILHSDGSQVRDYVSVYSVVEALILALKSKTLNERIYNICSGTPLSVNQIIGFVASHFKDPINVYFRDSEKLWIDYPEFDQKHFRLAPNVIAEETNKHSVGSARRFSDETGWVSEIPNEENFGVVIDKIRLKIKRDGLS